MGGGGLVIGGGFVAEGGPSVGGGGAGSSVVGGASPGAGGGTSVAGGRFSAPRGGSSVGGGSSVVGGGTSVAGGGSSVVGGGTSVAGGGSTVAGEVVGSLVVGSGASVVIVGEVSRVLGGDVSPVPPVLGEGFPEVDVTVLGGVRRDAGEGVTGLLLALANRAIPELPAAPTKPSRTFRTVFCAVSLLASSSVAACSSICSATPGRTRSTTCRGIGLSESGANQVRNETTATAAAITPAPANKDLCLSPLRRPRRGFGRGRRVGAFSPRPLTTLLSALA